jgi:hypothetical protein
MSSSHDPIRLLRLALRTGDAELANTLVRALRRDRSLSDRADLELRATHRRRSPTPSPLAQRTYRGLVERLGLNGGLG